MTRRNVGGEMGPSFPDDLAALMLESVEPVELPEGARDSMRNRLMGRIAAERGGITTVRAHDGEWRSFVPGVMGKTLHDDGRTRTWLARMAPGATVPAHVHEGVEEILILEGSCILGRETMNAGDFERAPHGSSHPEMRSASGCLLLIRSVAAIAASP